MGDGFEDAIGGRDVHACRQPATDQVAVDQQGTGSAGGIRKAQGKGKAGFSVAGGGAGDGENAPFIGAAGVDL